MEFFCQVPHILQTKTKDQLGKDGLVEVRYIHCAGVGRAVSFSAHSTVIGAGVAV